MYEFPAAKPDYDFSLIVPAGQNFTAASLMHRYAKENGATHTYSKNGRSILNIHGIFYAFDHWTINQNGDGTETVTVYLFDCSHLIEHLM